MFAQCCQDVRRVRRNANDVKAFPDGVKCHAQEVAVHLAGLRNQQARTLPVGQTFIVRLLAHEEQRHGPGTLQGRTMPQTAEPSPSGSVAAMILILVCTGPGTRLRGINSSKPAHLSLFVYPSNP